MENNSNKTKEVNVLPSKHQINDPVIVNLGDSGRVIGCSVIKVHFSESKVLYDIVVTDLNTRLYNIDSCFVLSIDDRSDSFSGEIEKASNMSYSEQLNGLDKAMDGIESIIG